MNLLRIIKDYWLEFLVLISLAFGLFLIVEPFEIAKTLIDNIANYDQGMASMLTEVYPAIQQRVSADLMGLILLFIAFLVLYYRARNRFIKYSYNFIDSCPRWQHNHRIHQIDPDRC
jgi:hypothetical protein